MAHLGFVGLGVMGSRMVKRLLDAGHMVVGYKRTRARAEWLVDAGMQWGETPAAVARAAEVTFSMVRDTGALRAITEGPAGLLAGLAQGKVYVDMSTVSPAVSADLATQVAARGAQMLDAPVSGSVSTLEQGNPSLMSRGGPGRARGPRVTYVGGNGQAVLMKIATNLSLAVQMLAFSEGLLLAEKSGIPRATAVEVLLNSVIASPMLLYRGPFVLEMQEEAWFDVTMMQKDMQLALEMGRKLDVPLPTTAVTNEMLTAARGMGLEKRDFAVLYDVMARLAGGHA